MQLAAIAVPITLQNLINVGVSMADTIMLGMLGEVQLSAASIANQFGFVFLLLSFGTGSGSSVLIAQFWGKGDIESINKVITVMYRIMLSAALVFTALAMIFPARIMMVFTTDAQVIAEGAVFLRIVGASYVFMGLATSTITMLRAIRSVKISIVVYICSLLTNVFLNWVLIFGNLGAPALGVAGAAIATCIARFVEFMIAAVYVLVYEKKINYRLKMFFTKNLHILGNFMSNALPVVFNEFIWGSGAATISIIVGRMGKEFIAANAVCSVLSQLVTIMLFGVANASAVVMGNTVGKGDYLLAKTYAKTLLVLSFLLGLVSCGIVLILKNPMLSFYNISPLAKIYANQIMTIHSVVVIFIALAATNLMGVLRGGGDTRYVLLMDVIFMWCVSIPMGFFTGLYLHWPVWAVYIVIKSDEVLKVFCSLIRVYKGNWINDITINREQN